MSVVIREKRESPEGYNMYFVKRQILQISFFASERKSTGDGHQEQDEKGCFLFDRL